MKTVAIIGAGPSGLVAAKTLLRSRCCKFDVSVFEKRAIVGGLWAVDRNDADPEQLLGANMPTNASRFTVSFSDFAWSSVDLRDPRKERAQPFVPMFPRAWQVQRYLSQYSKRYIPDGVIAFSTTVTSTERVTTAAGATAWKVEWRANDDASRSTTRNFDYLIVASGFFAEPSMPFPAELGLTGLSGTVKHIHSSKLRRLEDVAPSDPERRGTLLVVGGAMSGSEAAAALAFDLSNREHEPASQGRPALNVLQIVPRPVYALPPIVPYQDADTEAPKFFTLDLTFYDVTRRPPGPINPGQGRQPSEISNGSHSYLRSLVGGDQSELTSPEVVASDTTQPAFAAIQESYPEFLRSGAIKTSAGRLTALSASDSTHVSAEITNGESSQTIDDVVGIVYATGFKPTTALNILPADVKKALQYDPTCARLPLILGDQSIMAPTVPGLAFIGFYEGPFWAAMEKQAEKIADVWGNEQLPQTGDDAATAQRHAETLHDLRNAMQTRAIDVPQYWMGDYVGIIEKLSRELGIERNEMGLEARTGPVFGARYAGKASDAEEAQKLVEDLMQARSEALERGRFVARATFRAMQGKWRIDRRLESFLAAYPSGRLTGEAIFHPRVPTDSSYDGEYLFIENGTLTTLQGLTLQASRRYVYRYQEANDQITVWFVKDDGKTVDYLYNELAFETPPGGAWVARSDHLCIADMYKSEYEFRFKGMHLRKFTVKHVVKGPKKDYIADTLFER